MQMPPRHGAGDAPSASEHDRRRQRRAAAAPTAAATRPPSTSAPSPPMTTRPSRAGSATHSAVSSSGAARCSVFCSENQVPKPPRPHQREELQRRLALHQQEQGEDRQPTAAAPASGMAMASAPPQADPIRGPPASGGADRLEGAIQGDAHRPSLRRSGGRADDALDQVVHAFELDRGLGEAWPGRDDPLPLLSLSGPLMTRRSRPSSSRP